MPTGAVELPGNSSLPISHFQQSLTTFVFVTNFAVIKVADTLVTTDENTNTLNYALWLASFLFAIKWHFTISSFHSTFHSHFRKSPAVLRWPLGGIQCDCLQLRNI